MDASQSVSAKPLPETIISECIHKIIQIVVKARVPLHNPDSSSKSLNKWFNLQMSELAGVRHDTEQLISAAASQHTQQTQTSLSSSTSGTQIIITPHVIQLDILVRNSRDHTQKTLMERWNVHHERDVFAPSSSSSRKPVDPSAMYKKMLLLVRSLYSFVRILPCCTLYKYAQRALLDKQHEPCPFNVHHALSSLGANNTPTELFDQSPMQFIFTSIPTPLGKFHLSVFYRGDYNNLSFLPNLLPIYKPLSTAPSPSPSPSASPDPSLDSSVVHSVAQINDHIIQDYMSLPPSGSVMSSQQQIQAQVQPQVLQASAAQQQAQAAHQPVSGLSLGLEQEKRKRQEQMILQQQQQQQQLGFNPDRRHTVPHNQLYSQAPVSSLSSSLQPEVQYIPPAHHERERAHSLFHASSNPSHSLPRESYMTHHQPASTRERSDSTGSDSNPSSTVSKPMSIPRSMSSNGSRTGSYVPPSSQPQQFSHSGSLHQYHTHSAIPHSQSHSPSHSDTSTQNTPPGVFGTPTSSPPTTSMMHHIHNNTNIPHSSFSSRSSSSNQLANLVEEEGDVNLYDDVNVDMEHTFANNALHHTHQHTSSSRGLPHSQSQPIHINPSASRSRSSSVTQPIAIPPSSSLSHSRSSSRLGTSPHSFTGSPTGSFTSTKPPLPSSRVPFPAGNASGTSSPAPSTIVIREKEPIMSTRFPPPVLSSSMQAHADAITTPSSGLHQSLMNSANSPIAHKLTSFPSPSLSTSSSNLASPPPTNPTPTRMSNASPLSSPAPASGLSVSRPISIPARPANDSQAGSVYGRTPPFISSSQPKSNSFTTPFSNSLATLAAGSYGPTTFTPSPPHTMIQDALLNTAITTPNSNSASGSASSSRRPSTVGIDAAVPFKTPASRGSISIPGDGNDNPIVTTPLTAAAAASRPHQSLYQSTSTPFLGLADDHSIHANPNDNRAELGAFIEMLQTAEPLQAFDDGRDPNDVVRVKQQPVWQLFQQLEQLSKAPFLINAQQQQQTHQHAQMPN